MHELEIQLVFLLITINTDMVSLIVQPLAPSPQTHTSDCPIFKIPFDSENLGKFMTSD